jgi:arylsulfatase
MVYTFDHANAPSQHHEQYFEMLGHRAYYKDGWMASSMPAVPPWDRTRSVDPNTLSWELYDLSDDYSQAHDVASNYPQKLAELRAGFDTAAHKYNVYPLTADIMRRVGPGVRPTVLDGRKHFSYGPGQTRYTAGSFPGLGAGSALTARLELLDAKASGPIVVQGDVFGGMGLLLSDGRPTFLFNPTGRESERVTLQASSALAPGSHEVQVRVAAQPEKGPRAAQFTMSVDGKPVAVGEIGTLYRSRGEAFVGRRGLGTLLPGQPIGELTGATVRSVDVDMQ